MRKKVGLILLIAAAASAIWILFAFLRVDYWLAPPPEKFAREWKSDIALLEKTNALPKQWTDIKEITVRTDHSPIQDWIVSVKPPVRTHPKGRYKLDVFLIHWIEKNRYGVVAQYNLVDLTNNNTVWELGRTYKLGIVY